MKLADMLASIRPARERGAIRNSQVRHQCADFTGLRWDNITPTDLDGFLDFGDRLFVFIEGKHGDTEMPKGQRTALERLCDAYHDNRRVAVGFVVTHSTPLDRDIDYAAATIRMFRWRRRWLKPPQETSLRIGIDVMRARCGLGQWSEPDPLLPSDCEEIPIPACIECGESLRYPISGLFNFKCRNCVVRYVASCPAFLVERTVEQVRMAEGAAAAADFILAVQEETLRRREWIRNYNELSVSMTGQ